MYHRHLPVDRWSGSRLFRQSESQARFRRLLASFVIALGLLAFSLAASPGEGRFSAFESKVALADGGHSQGGLPDLRTPTPLNAHEPEQTDAQHDMGMEGTEGTHDTSVDSSPESHEATGQDAHAPQASSPQNDAEMSEEHALSSSDEADTAREQATGDGGTAEDHESAGSDNHEAESATPNDPEDTGSEGMSGRDDHGNTAPDDHGAAGTEGSGSDSHGAEAEGPSDLARNLTLGGFAAINGSVLVTAAILKKKSPRKGRNRAAVHGTGPAHEAIKTAAAAPITLSVEPAPVVAPVVAPVLTPFTEPIDIADASATEGEDVA
jgi:hypothetical protein